MFDFLLTSIKRKEVQGAIIVIVIGLFIWLTCNNWLTSQYRLKYQQGYDEGFADGFAGIDTTFITDTVSVVDTFYLPAEIDSTSEPYVASGRIKLARNGYVDIQYKFPPVNAFSPVEIRMPDPVIITKPVIQHKVEYTLDWQKSCLFLVAGIASGAGSIILLMYSLK